MDALTVFIIAGFVIFLVWIIFSATNNKTTSHKKSQRTGASAAMTGRIKSGLYLVKLNNEEPISVNANDPRIAHKAIKATKANCKFGRAKNLAAREKGYFKVFGEHNVNFKPLVKMEETDIAEKAILKCLDNYRIRGRTGRKNEWLKNISPETVEAIVFSTLKKTGIKYEKIQALRNRRLIQSFVNDSGSALLDSGLRRNDDEEQKSLVAIPMARLPLPANARLRPLSSFMDRKSCMRRDAYRDVGGRPRRERAVEGRTPGAAMDRMSCMRREGRTPGAAMDRKSCMRREGTPAWMHAYRDVRLQGCRW